MPIHKDAPYSELHSSKVVGTNNNIVSITDNIAVDSGIALADLDVGIFTRDDLTTTVTLFNSGDTVDLDGTLKTDTIDEHNAGSGITVDGVLLKDNDVVADEVTVSDGKIILNADDYLEISEAGNYFEVKSESENIIKIDNTLHNILCGYRAGNALTTGQRNLYLGYSAGASSATGNGNFALGSYAGYANTSSGSVGFVGIGTDVGFYNTSGVRWVGIGLSAGKKNTTGGYWTSIGQTSGYSTLDAGYFVGIGSNSLYYATGNYNTAIGVGAFSAFKDNSGGAKTFDNTDVSSQNITITAHGFGSTGAYVNLRFTQGTGTIGGMTDDGVYSFKIIDANTIQSFAFTISSPTGTGHTLTPQFRYSNVTALGYNAEPDASNQVVLGDTNVTEVKSSGVGNFGGAKIGDGGTTDYLSVASDGTVTLYGDARYDDCINITPGAVSALGSGAATQVARGLDTAWEYADNLVRQTSVTTPLRPNMDRTVAPTLRVFWESPTTSATCKWQLDYIYRKANEDMSTTSGTTVSVDGTSSATANGLVYTDFTLATPDSDDIEIVMRLTRNGDAAGDTLGDSAYTHGGKIMYKANKL